MACSKVNANLDVTCAALKRAGGINQRFWIANLEDIASYTVDATSKAITAITMAGVTVIYSYTGKKDKHSGSIELQTGEAVNSFKQMLNVVLYTSTSAEDVKIETLCNSDDLVVICEENDGQFTVWGLDVNAGNTSYPVGGLAVESATKGTGTTVNERAPWNITMSGNFRNCERIFVSTDYAGSIAALVALE